MSDLIEREAVIKALLEHEDAKGYLHGDFEEIINELPSVTPTEHKPICDDCIYFDNGKGSEKCDSCELTGTNKPSRRKGHWAKTGQSFLNPNKFRNFCCTECSHELDEHIRKEPNYCPSCGAKMVEPQESEERE